MNTGRLALRTHFHSHNGLPSREHVSIESLYHLARCHSRNEYLADISQHLSRIEVSWERRKKGLAEGEAIGTQEGTPAACRLVEVRDLSRPVSLKKRPPATPDFSRKLNGSCTLADKGWEQTFGAQYASVLGC